MIPTTQCQPSDPQDGYVVRNGTTSYDPNAHGRAVLGKFSDSLSRHVLELLADGHSSADILAGGMTEDILCQAAEDALVAIDYCLHHHRDRQAEIKAANPMATKPWTAAQDAHLAKRQAEGASVPDLAAELQRTQGSISSRLAATGLRRKQALHRNN